LTQSFADIDAGVYQIVTAGTLFEMTIPEAVFIAPNSPGFLVTVLTQGGQGPKGPNDRDVVFQQDPQALWGVGVGHTRDTEPVGLSAPEDLLAAPGNLEITNVDDGLTIGGVPATRFDVRVDPSATCQAGDPCLYIITGRARNFIKRIRPGTVSRFYWLEVTDGPPILIGATAAELRADEFFAEVGTMLESITFVSG
jgi:hypothetical protein